MEEWCVDGKYRVLEMCVENVMYSKVVFRVKNRIAQVTKKLAAII